MVLGAGLLQHTPLSRPTPTGREQALPEASHCLPPSHHCLSGSQLPAPRVNSPPTASCHDFTMQDKLHCALRPSYMRYAHTCGLVASPGCGLINSHTHGPTPQTWPTIISRAKPGIYAHGSAYIPTPALPPASMLPSPTRPIT